MLRNHQELRALTCRRSDYGQPELPVSGQVTKFLVTTPATALYWDINGVVELEPVAQGRDGRKHEGRYLANCTDRTFAFPSNDLVAGAVTACLGEIGAKLRKDNVLVSILEAPQADSGELRSPGGRRL